MHPIISRPRRLGLYAIAWAPLTVLLLYLFRAAGLTAPEAGVLLCVLVPLYAVMCLSAWYPSRATPIQTSGFARVAVTQAAAAIVVSTVWTALAALYIAALGLLEPFQSLPGHPGVLRLIFATGILLYLLSAAFHYVLFSMEAARESEEREYGARVLAREAELRALKAQINPHFIFNCLHSISALTAVDPGKAREMCISLADFLRITLGMGQKSQIPLGEELALARRFLDIERVRFGTRLQVEEAIDDTVLTCVVPPLLLQPLVENAITHGVAHLPEGGWIHLNAQASGDRLTISIENNFDPDSRSSRRSGIGLANVRERIEARYGNAASFSANADGDRFRVALSMPLERSAA
jgi:signal transduction histidine kinase